MLKIIINAILLGIGVAIDAMAVSITNGLNYSYIKKNTYFHHTLCFGIFQALMPTLGYFIGSYTLSCFIDYLPIISFVILVFLGFKTLYESLFPSDTKSTNKELTTKTILIQALATSIDALSVGITLINLKSIQLFITILIIFFITFIMCSFGYELGKKFGLKYKTTAEILGGIILIILGIKCLII